MPLLALDERDPQVRIIPLDGFPPRVLAVAWHRDRYRSPAIDGFLQLALESDLVRL